MAGFLKAFGSVKPGDVVGGILALAIGTFGRRRDRRFVGGKTCGRVGAEAADRGVFGKGARYPITVHTYTYTYIPYTYIYIYIYIFMHVCMCVSLSSLSLSLSLSVSLSRYIFEIFEPHP